MKKKRMTRLEDPVELHQLRVEDREALEVLRVGSMSHPLGEEGKVVPGTGLGSPCQTEEEVICYAISLYCFKLLTVIFLLIFSAAEDTAAIRVSNLSENTQEGDLQELFKPFGHIARIFLAKDKITGQCKGFAFINYVRKDDAAKAIATLDGYGYDHLILNVEWAKPSGT